jgi:hypothetical protein
VPLEPAELIVIPVVFVAIVPEVEIFGSPGLLSKPVAVPWGDVAGQKKVGPKTAGAAGKKPKKPKGQTAQLAQTASDAYIKGQEALLQDSRLNDSAKAAIQESIDKFKAKLGQ